MKTNILALLFVAFGTAASFSAMAEQSAPPANDAPPSAQRPFLDGRGGPMGGGMRQPVAGPMRGHPRGEPLLTMEERTAHRDKLFAAKTIEECRAARAETHALVVSRAKEKGVEVPPAPRRDRCEAMQRKGMVR